MDIPLAQNLRAARRRAGFTLQEVADACGVAGRATVSRWEAEQDARVPEPAILVKLARLYGVSMDYLFGLQHGREENPELLAVRAAVHEQLFRPQALSQFAPAERVRRILAVAAEVAAAAVPEHRIRKCLGPAYDDVMAGRADVPLPVEGLADLAYLFGLPARVLLEPPK